MWGQTQRCSVCTVAGHASEGSMSVRTVILPLAPACPSFPCAGRESGWSKRRKGSCHACARAPTDASTCLRHAPVTRPWRWGLGARWDGHDENQRSTEPLHTRYSTLFTTTVQYYYHQESHRAGWKLIGKVLILCRSVRPRHKHARNTPAFDGET